MTRGQAKKPYDLNRFLEAQSQGYEGYAAALSEIKSGHKGSHWIWYIFPQLMQLGRSSTAKYYGIADIDEAKAYLAKPTLRARLIEISTAMLGLSENNPIHILGHTDAMKVKSCMTLFLMAEPDNAVFKDVLDKFYGGGLDEETLEILSESH